MSRLLKEWIVVSAVAHVPLLGLALFAAGLIALDNSSGDPLSHFHPVGIGAATIFAGAPFILAYGAPCYVLFKRRGWADGARVSMLVLLWPAIALACGWWGWAAGPLFWGGAIVGSFAHVVCARLPMLVEHDRAQRERRVQRRRRALHERRAVRAPSSSAVNALSL